ncbi:DgyrCDS7642 [Dimorphilus gyrociliatus]|uniref:Enolase 4 n=1 Tax=Dimorphilus gyrociliatus TaxID=2664684 RepID=A0A7I8VRR2_9ANNE|nr:DgyrCDS7642 [Dimorphilus gyrociliatus]
MEKVELEEPLPEIQYRKATSAEMYALKKQAVQYYKENGVPLKMENVMNEMFYDRPDDVFGHIANYFESFAKAVTINKVELLDTFDSRGQQSLTTNLYGIVRNNSKLLAETQLTSSSRLPDYSSPEEKENDAVERQESLKASIELINDKISPVLIGIDVNEQNQIDEEISKILLPLQEALDKERQEEENKKKEEQERIEAEKVVSAKDKRKSPKVKGKGAAVVIIPDEPKDKLIPGYESGCIVSKSVCKAGSFVKNCELYEYIGSLTGKDQFKIPLPMFTIFYSGRAAPGKQNYVKEYMIIPSPTKTLSQAVKESVQIYNTIGDILASKAAASDKGGKKQNSIINEGPYITSKLVNDTGAFCTPLDRIEQGLDLIQDAMKHLNLESGTDFYFALNLSGQEVFDYEKGKYEIVAGIQKTGDDLADVLNDILNKYPGVIALIDPVRKEEKQAWQKISEKISPRCYIGRNVNTRHFFNDIPNPELPISASVLKLETSTISHITSVISHSDANEIVTIMQSSQGESEDSFISDLAVANDCKFIHVGAPCRGERLSKVNRLLRIEQLLGDKALKWPENFEFPYLPIPQVEEPEEEEKVE